MSICEKCTSYLLLHVVSLVLLLLSGNSFLYFNSEVPVDYLSHKKDSKSFGLQVAKTSNFQLTKTNFVTFFLFESPVPTD